MSNSYFDLLGKLEALEASLDNETEPRVVEEIKSKISEVKNQIDEYDLSADDLFMCDCCGKISDIEDSTKKGDNYTCPRCL